MFKGSKLDGMKEICSYVHRSETTVLRWIHQYGFPAEKNSEGEWVSRKGPIDEWRRDMAGLGVFEIEKSSEPKKRKKAPRIPRW